MLPGGARRHQHVAAAEGAPGRAQRTLHVRQYLLWLDHPPGPVAGTFGQGTDGRTHNHPTALAEGLDVLLGRRVGEHLVVHPRGDEHGRGGSQQHGGQQIVGQSLCGSGQEVCGRWSDDDQIWITGQVDVRKRPAALPQGCRDRAFGECFECEGANELGGRGSQHHVHRRACLGQPPGECADLVGCNPARHAEDDAPAREVHVSWRRRRTRR